ncbi:MAG: sugar phosphate nucleotidyltransferase [Rikenellaceae bacterium]
MKPTLLILAAGMGSRYGSLKQMDGIGPNKEAILDYSVFDAARAGFGKVVFVIRHSFEAEFKEVFSKKHFGNKIDVDYVFQELDYLPKGVTVPEGREKPWGTNHALMMGAKAINEPFAVINADDFYGEDAFKTLAKELVNMEGKTNEYCMVGYRLANTMSDFGSVSRGVCTANEKGNLVSIVERTEIVKCENGAQFRNEKKEMQDIDVNTLVSMNMFGFTPDFFKYSDDRFMAFLEAAKKSGNLKAEYLIPTVVNDLINEGKVTLKVLSSDAKWFGVTYKEDRPIVVAKLQALISAGRYPQKLWE